MAIADHPIFVSIIIPVYNAQNFLHDTVKSVINQNFADFEVILINDGSTDDSEEICKYYSSQDRRITLINQANSGVSIARNNGFLKAKGEYVFFMDSDDTLSSDMIKTSYQIAKAEKKDIVVIGEQFCRRLPDAAAFPTWALLLRRSFLNPYSDVRFPENIQPCEDGLFSHQLLALTREIGQNPQGIYHYRHHDNQNHLKINSDCWKVIRQIPDWFVILEKFYSRYHLLPSRALHLARFVEHEPFEFRYLAMPLDYEQKKELRQLIIDFMNGVVLPHLDEESKNTLSIPFLNFIDSNSVDDFELFYSNYSKQRERKKKLYLFWIKFIPLKNIRRKLRAKINDQY